jgi:hypothetical protein
MATQTKTPKTLVSFDLREILKPDELARFQSAARKAGAKSLTEHFLNITLRLNEKQAA